MKTKQILSIILILIIISIGTATAKHFEGTEITDGTFREMVNCWTKGEQVYWNGEPITIEDARAIYYESHPDSKPLYNVVKHVGSSTVSYKGSSSGSEDGGIVSPIGDNPEDEPPESSDSFDISDNKNCFIFGSVGGTGDLNIHDNKRVGFNLKYTGSGSINVYDNKRVSGIIYNPGDAPVSMWGNKKSSLRVVNIPRFVLA